MGGTPNLFAHLVLLLWIPVCLLVGAKARGTKCFLLVFLGGTLLLPEQLAIKVPVLPPLNKHMFTLAAATIVCTSAYRGSRAKPGWVMPALVVLIVGSAFLTASTNPEAIQIGPRILQAMTLYDGFSTAVSDLCLIALPFYLGMRHFRTVDDLRLILLGVAIAALIYAPFTLLEARLSPVMHRWIYGYFQHDWFQTKRAGGFRAFVFLEHGLAVAFLYAQAVIVALSIFREKTVSVSSPLRKAFYILFPITLLTCKSLGATIYAVAAGLLFLISGPKGIGSLARILALFSLCFPLLRYNGWFPIEDVLRWATDLDPLRAESLAFRFRNEENLLVEASHKYWFGWGGWGRGRIYDEVTGKNRTVVDGFWIIVLSGRGLVGFLTQFGLLTLPVLSAVRRLRLLPREEMAVLATVAFIAAISVVELLPNGLFHLFPWVVAGALTSVSAELKAREGRRIVTEPAGRVLR